MNSFDLLAALNGSVELESASHYTDRKTEAGEVTERPCRDVVKEALESSPSSTR